MEIDEWESLEQALLEGCWYAKLCGGESAPVSYTFLSGDQELQLDVLTARTWQEKALGLMFRDETEMADGMLFMWSTPVRAEFHMSNVRVPLHIYWFDMDGACMASRPLVPEDPTRHTAMTPFRYALEVPSHVAEKLGENPRLKLS